MGQYHFVVNLDRREFIHPHDLASGLKAREQLGSPVSAALLVLLFHPVSRGGGDIRMEAEDDPAYATLALDTVGRWRGCRIAEIGDYAQDGDLSGDGLPGIREGEPTERQIMYSISQRDGLFKNVSEQVARVLEVNMNGAFYGQGWRTFITEGSSVAQWNYDVMPAVKRLGKVTKLIRGEGITVEWAPQCTETYTFDDIKEQMIFVE